MIADPEMSDMYAFIAVARAGGFREAARIHGSSPSGLSEAVRRLEDKLGVRLLHRTTRSVTATQEGQCLLERLHPALTEIRAALDAVAGSHEIPTGTLRLNVPASVARLILPPIVSEFLVAYPQVCLEVLAESSFVDVLAAGCDAGIRYGNRIDMDMIAVPIGPRRQRFAAAAAPSYLSLRKCPQHPLDLTAHACIRQRSARGHMPPWIFEKDGEVLQIDASGPLVFGLGTATDLAVEAALSGAGIIYLFEEWLQPHFASGALVPVIETWWQEFEGPFLYYHDRRLVPAPLKAFIDFIKALPEKP